MLTPAGLLKPCYIFAPRTLARRVGVAISRKTPSVVEVQLPWGATLEVNAKETIGREIFRQKVFDIAVSETAWRLLQPGDVAVDVGANIGYMTSLFASRVGSSGRVEAFEPHPRIFARLKANVARDSKGARVRLHDTALGNREGVAHLGEPNTFGRNEGVSTIVGSEVGLPGGAKYEVRMRRLDAVLDESNVDLLKLDVEGFERQVLAGAERLLSRRRIQHLIYEAHDCARSPLDDVLKGHGYRIFGIGHTIFGPKLTPGEAAPLVDRSWESPSYLATLDPDGVSVLFRRSGWQVLRSM